ncbi:MFS-type transporter SLC18B1-like [Paramacrobiotus metropolitanus]|uniref:MFS-type transporter SLC18B1-like n=1 Tax=Paramacrobiotus metropolitanus TaxID=2943436 RepID=UPI00244647BF|nr:MFS-type transporter SLC18B1-like [Paramacrobiotus metropolitanus]
MMPSDPLLSPANPEERPRYENFFSVSRDKKIILATLCLGNFFTSTFYACIAVFFPSFAHEKGATESDVGLIFGIMQLVIFVFSFVWGLTIHNIGTKFMYVSGIMVAGSAAALMGVLEYCPSSSFVAMCFLTRLVEGLGASAVVTSSFTVIADEFPNSVSTMFGTCETFSGLGFMLGPVIGGSLFHLGGFKTPFLVLGGVVILCGLLALKTLPLNKTSRGRDYGTFKNYIKIPAVLVTLLAVFTITCGMGFIDASFSNHLRQFVPQQILLSLVFMIPTAVYFFSAPLIGYALDRFGRAWEFILAGGVFSVVAYLLMGPSPIFPADLHRLWLIIIGNVCMGFGVGMQLIPPFGKNLQTAIEHGFPETIDTYGMVSGSLNSAVSLGAFLGPTIGGAFYDDVGFEWTLSGFAILQICVTLITGILFLWLRYRRRSDSMGYSSYMGRPRVASAAEEDEPFILRA